MPKPLIKHFGKIMNGKVYYSNEPLWNQQKLALEGKEFELVIKERHKKPTTDQYGYYRGGILGACYESEMFSHFDKPDDIHDLYFAPKFLSEKRLVVLQNERYEITHIRSMADLDRKETAEFLNKVLSDCSLNGIEVLSPEDYLTKSFNKFNHG